jgi:hypothetical protein
VLTVAGDEDVKAVIDAHGVWIADEVLATELVYSAANETQAAKEGMRAVDLDGITAFVAITRIQ